MGDDETIRDRPSNRPPSATSDSASTRLDEPGSSTQRRLASSSDYLVAEEVARVHGFTGGILVVISAGLLCVAFIPAPPLAKQIAAVGLLALALGFAYLRVISRSVETFDPNVAGRVAVFMAATSATQVYYFGPNSAFPCIVSVGLYAYGIGGPYRHGLAVYVAAALGQAALGIPMAFGFVEDVGVISSEEVPTIARVVGQVAIQTIYAMSFFVGRATAKRSRDLLVNLESAVRDVAAREALLREARLELDRAAPIGEPGRFTEQELGSFKLGVVIGRGGMGEIYEAVHLESGTPAAVKLLQRRVLESGGDPVARFEREAKIASTLESPYIVRVLEIGGEEAPLPYLAMERLEGHDLAWHLRHHTRMAPHEVVELVHHVAGGLMVAREHDIVHRDLKPQNLFRTEGAGGVWKILDFGVSRLAGEPGTLTAGHLVGTPAYMAPEQASGEGVQDHRVDVYALCVIAYRALTGRPAFSGKDIPRVVHEVMTKLPPRPSQLCRVSPAVDAVLRVGLAKDPDDRFEDAKSLAVALSDALAGTLDDPLAARADKLNAALPWGKR